MKTKEEKLALTMAILSALGLAALTIQAIAAPKLTTAKTKATTCKDSSISVETKDGQKLITYIPAEKHCEE